MMDFMSILKNLYGGAGSRMPTAPEQTPPIIAPDHGAPVDMPIDRGSKGSGDIGSTPPILGAHNTDQAAGGSPLAGILKAVGQLAGQHKQQDVAAQPLTPMSGIYQRPQPVPYDPSQYQPMRRY